MGYVILIMVGLLLVVSAEARDWHFAPWGSDGGACTQGQPCRTLGKAREVIRSANPGDRLLFRGGQVWDGQWNHCLTATNVHGLYLGRYGTGRAIFEHCAVGIWARQSNNWTVENLEIRHSSYGIRSEGSSGWTVQNLRLHHFMSVCGYLLPRAGGLYNFPRTTGWTFKGNECFETGLSSNGEGFYLISASDILFQGNTFHHTRDEAINFKNQSHHITIRDNVFRNGIKSGRRSWLEKLVRSAWAGQSTVEDVAIGGTFADSHDIIIEGNDIISMPTAGIRIHKVTGVVVQNNFISMTPIGVEFRDGATGSILANTFVDVTTPIFIGTGAGDVEVEGNIFE
jgi:hypothetical protein